MKKNAYGRSYLVFAQWCVGPKSNQELQIRGCVQPHRLAVHAMRWHYIDNHGRTHTQTLKTPAAHSATHHTAPSPPLRPRCRTLPPYHSPRWTRAFIHAPILCSPLGPAAPCESGLQNCFGHNQRPIPYLEILPQCTISFFLCILSLA